MRRYETIVIVDPELSEEQRNPIFERITELISHQNGVLVKVDSWGNKKLSYDIKKKVRGHYSLIDYCGSGTLVDEIERFFKIDDRVLKFMTVVRDKKADLEQIQEEIAAAAAAEAESSSAGKSETDQSPVETAGTEAEESQGLTTDTTKEES